MIKYFVPIHIFLDRIIASPLLLFRRLKYGYTFRRIHLGEGVYAIVDPKDYYILCNYNWYFGGNGNQYYAFRNTITTPGRSKMISMHRQLMHHQLKTKHSKIGWQPLNEQSERSGWFFLPFPRRSKMSKLRESTKNQHPHKLGTPPLFTNHYSLMTNMVVDHINNNSLDNRRSNLRLATRSQNACNRPKINKKTSSKYIGVYFEKRTGRYTVKIRTGGKRLWLGRFKNETDAARAYDTAAKKYHKQFATLNFPCPEYSRGAKNKH